MPPHPPGAVRLEAGADGLVLHLHGEVDAATVARWERDRPADGDVGQGAVVAVDASAAGFLNSAGVALLVRETEPHRRAGGRPELRRPSRGVLQVLRLTGVVGLFDVVTD
ncbi:STAS domain-containing protein [Geodermatophilus sp. DSM 44513]|uniref:STAS domain-containing protein n=1 Tax=Geodermatophilus sp. DSM 44513 TaxID=1528104 RepID=UPI0014124135|nr:STAS domain-containing protein [Geodermatophilus sp. DSM 44513]WNV75125.1 STAS domain-containing protein [Geodermatophilus sp. DSM 44513]